MPMFDIETYKVSSYLERFSGETRLTRVLEMTGPVLFHGIQNHALFAFVSSFNGFAGQNPVAGYPVDGGFSGLSVTGWFPVAEFSYYYDILRNERPVQVLYEFRDASVTSGYLSQVGLGMSTEPIGEGPSDSDAQIAAALKFPIRRFVLRPPKKYLRKQHE